MSTAYNSLGSYNMYAFPDTDGNLIGILGEMLNSFSSHLNFKMNAKGIPVSDYGTKLQNGSFTGFVGMLQRRKKVTQRRKEEKITTNELHQPSHSTTNISR